MGKYKGGIMSSMSEGGSLPLQLTTITVAVPAPLSPNSAAVLSVPGMNIGGSALSSPLGQQQQDYGAFKWKYEQTRTDKLGSTLVRSKHSNLKQNFTNKNNFYK